MFNNGTFVALTPPVMTTKTISVTAKASCFKLINYSLKSDLIGGIFIFGWICTLLTVEILSFQFGSLTAKFYEILPRKNGIEFGEMCVKFGAFLVMMALGKGSLLATRGLLGRAMRRNLTHCLHERYIKSQGLKSLLQSPFLDNSDQRITEDVDRFTHGLVDITEVIIMAPVLVIFYTVQVSQRLGSVSLALIYAHFLASLLILRLGMSRLKDLTAKKEQREAEFRYEHVNLRANAESFVLINSDTLFKRLHFNLNSQLRRLLFTTKQFIMTESVMELGKNLFSYSGALLNFALLAGELTWGRWRTETDPAKIANLISMTSFLSLYLIFQLSKLAGVVDSLGILNGQIKRLTEFLNILERKSNNNNVDSLTSDSDFEIEFNSFKYSNPSNLNLFSNDSGLSLTFKSGDNVLVSGPNGSGKTSILRLISGVWHVQSDCSGYFTVKPSKPSTDRPFMMTCPQTCALFSGSLYDLLGIKDSKIIDGDDDEESVKKQISQSPQVEESLSTVGLSIKDLEPFNLVRSISTWQSILTPGQHQRLSIARAILHRPHLLAMDESCLAMNNQETLRILEELHKRNVTVIFIDPAESSKEFESFFQCKINL